MENDVELYREFLRNLEKDECRSLALSDIKNLLLYKSNSETGNMIRNVGISKILQCLNVQDQIHLDLTCEVIKLYFDKFSAGDIVKYHTGHIMYMLRHQKDCARRIAIEEVYKTVTADLNLMPVQEYIDVFVAVAQLTSDHDIGIANKAILITSNLSPEAYPKVLEEMKITLEFDNSSRCNTYEVIINASCKSHELLQLCGDHGYIDHMLSELHSSDVLYQLNILELLSRLAVQPHGIAYFVKNGTLTKISDMIIDLRANPYSNFLTPGYMKFFGNIAYHYPREIFEKYPVLLDCLFEAFESNDQSILPIALDTLAYIGSTVEGKLCLAALGRQYIEVLRKVVQLTMNSPMDIKIRALCCFASLISVESDPNLSKTGPVDHRVTLMTREWFRSLGTNNHTSIEILLQICKNPVPEIRMAAFKLLDAVCQHQWGEELVARTGGFVEFLLDRSVNYTKGAKEAKYDIIKRLSRSASFDTNVISTLQKYVEEGPFYSQPEMKVVTEEED